MSGFCVDVESSNLKPRPLSSLGKVKLSETFFPAQYWLPMDTWYEGCF